MAHHGLTRNGICRDRVSQEREGVCLYVCVPVLEPYDGNGAGERKGFCRTTCRVRGKGRTRLRDRLV